MSTDVHTASVVDPTASDRPAPARVRVWGASVRLFHLGLIVGVATSFLTGDHDDWIEVHTLAGAAIFGLVVFRVLLGLTGPELVRFRSFVHRPAEVWAYARALVRGRPPVHLGHNPLGGLMVVTLLATLGAVIASGVIMKLGPEWEGPLSPWMSRRSAHAVEELHEGAAGLLLALIAIHVVGVLVSSLVERQNLVAGMITGKKRASAGAPPPTSWARRTLGPALALVAGVAAAFTLASLLRGSEARAAETPSGLLERYRAAARREDPMFLEFKPDRGRALYSAQFEAGGKTPSCTSCHTEDPRRTGRSPAGKVLDPLAPGPESDRFTDFDEAEKWFDRNCKQVIGRRCTATEKGDVLAWLLTER